MKGYAIATDIDIEPSAYTGGFFDIFIPPQEDLCHAICRLLFSHMAELFLNRGTKKNRSLIAYFQVNFQQTLEQLNR